jgi:ring-1,2-phenylacetyl-CoA epoxidase subunit PaaE
MLYHLRIKQIIQETANTKSFVLESEDGRSLKYRAGQFLTFVFTHYNGDEDRRSYSLSSSPALNEPLTITVKRVANGEYSRKLVDEMRVGDELQTIGASGFFTLPDDIDKKEQLVFFAAGGGIAPIYSLIKTVLHKYHTVSVLLIYSNTSPDTTIFYNELKQLQNKFPATFKIEFLFSNSPDLLKARLGFSVLELLLKQHITVPLNNALYYLCGPYEYMQMITIKLRSEGVDNDNIKKEIFEIILPTVKPQPPNTDAHNVMLILNENEYPLNVQYPTTILRAAKQMNIPVPYSFESGQCGTCAATCLQGKVWMWHNEVLLDDEITKGRVLTCTGYAIEDNVVLKF